MSILNVAANRINSSVAGVTGLAQADQTANVPTAGLVERVSNTAQWGGLGNLFSDLSFEVSQPSSQPVSPTGPTGGAVPNNLATKPVMPTALGTWVGRVRQFLGL